MSTTATAARVTAVTPSLGLRYPVRLLPVLLLESLWTLLRLPLVALPRAAGGALDAPWRYAWQHLARDPGERWR